MILQWTSVDEIGQETTHKGFPVNLDNVESYAKHNHRMCNGKGYFWYDNGWLDIDNVERKQINLRAIACDCVVKTYNRTK